MRSDAAAPPVAVIGGGFSGVMTAVQLARRGVPVVLVEGGHRLGRGLAYSTREPCHLLNVPSARMSAWPDVPDDFQRWLGDDGTSFAPRERFGQYIGEILHGAGGITVIGQACDAVHRADSGWTLRMADRTEVRAAAVVLALGNEPPAPMPSLQAASELVVNDPWSREAADRIAKVAVTGGDVLLIGTGLTMIDSALALDEAGHEGRITALSRRGLLPRAHGRFDPAPVPLEQVPLGRVSALGRWLRRRSGEVGFRAAVDSLRPHGRAIWQSWSDAEQRRFLHHARPWWDVHRHRIAPQIAERIARMVEDGRLKVMAGRLRSLEASGAAAIERRASHPVDRRFDLVINCTGPLGDLRRSANPLLRQLLADGIAMLDAHHLGLRVDDRARAGTRMWAVGPLTKGMYWEIVAVPDIREQVAAVAHDIAVELGG